MGAVGRGVISLGAVSVQNVDFNYTAFPVDEECHEWKTWSRTFGATGSVARWFAEYFMFIVFATAFAGASAVLVRYYAPYAAGSGIPEVKTILGGFVIRKFLGGWTLL
ncbi:hypothetical protein BDK51DRAFT_29257, partial [Blyttiomyces helicus]